MIYGWMDGWMDGWVDGFHHPSVLSYINEAFTLIPESITPADFVLITTLVGYLFNDAFNIETIQRQSYDD
jgi:hypothetical protein